MPFFANDIYCPSCGYNLRGLQVGNACPECGRRVVSVDLSPDEQLKVKRTEQEIAENLQRIEDEIAQRERLTSMYDAWERRGERFDRLLDRIEALLDRHEKRDEP